MDKLTPEKPVETMRPVPVFPRSVVRGIDVIRDMIAGDPSLGTGIQGMEDAEDALRFFEGNYAEPEPIPEQEAPPEPEPDPLLEYRGLAAQLAAQNATTEDVLSWKEAADKAAEDANKPPPAKPTPSEALDAAVKAMDAAYEEIKAERVAAVEADKAAAKAKLAEISTATKQPDVFVKLTDEQQYGMRLIQEWLMVDTISEPRFGNPEHAAIASISPLIRNLFGTLYP